MDVFGFDLTPRGGIWEKKFFSKVLIGLVVFGLFFGPQGSVAPGDHCVRKVRGRPSFWLVEVGILGLRIRI